MKQTRILMGMPITLEVTDPFVTESIFDEVYSYFDYVDRKFSTYKQDSEISRINRAELSVEESSEDMQLIFALAEQTRLGTKGYFNIEHNGVYDPSGIVKGWAIYNAAGILPARGFQNFYVNAGGDIQTAGRNSFGEEWRVGIRNPMNQQEIVKVIFADNCGVATSGTYVRGQHIYNPHNAHQALTDVVSITVIGPNIYEADRFATAAFAMGRDGISFIEILQGLEGYMIDKNGLATFTSGFERFVFHDKVNRQLA